MKDKFMIMFFAGMGGWILNACSERGEVPSEGDGSPVCISAAVSEMESRAGTETGKPCPAALKSLVSPSMMISSPSFSTMIRKSSR